MPDQVSGDLLLEEVEGESADPWLAGQGVAEDVSSGVLVGRRTPMAAVLVVEVVVSVPSNVHGETITQNQSPGDICPFFRRWRELVMRHPPHAF